MTELQIVDCTQPTCVHHWVLREPASGLVLGRCRRCNATRAYPASPESTDRFDDYREITATSNYNSGRLSA
jgi:hypothetical protein